MNNEIIEISSDSDNGHDPEHRKYVVIVPGKPSAMPRAAFMAWMRNNELMRRVVNRASPQIKIFRQKFLDELSHRYGIATTNLPIYPDGGVVMIMTFCRRIPNAEFKGKQRWRPFVGGKYSCDSTWRDTKKPDIDNLAKFVMDSLNGVVYADDSQVVKTIMYKLVDNVAPFDGRTVVEFHRANRLDDLPKAIPHATSVLAEFIPLMEGRL